ncbi:MAG: hypothetical protein ACRD0U_20915, partial [Acidimicrobiales bacterium]
MLALTAAAVLVVAVMVVRDRGAEVEPAQAPSEGLPRLLLDLEGARLERAHESVVSAPAQQGTPSHLQAFRTNAGFDGPLLWITTVPDGAGYGFGEQSPDADQVQIQGTPAYLQVHDTVVWLGWPSGGAGGVSLAAYGLPKDTVVAVADGLRPRQDGAGWDTSALPDGLILVDDDPQAWEAGRSTEVTWVDERGHAIELFVNEGGESTFEGLVLDRVNSAVAVEAVTVLGRSGVLSSYAADDHAVIWRPNDATVAELRVGGSVEEARAALAAVRVVDEATWLAALPDGTVTPSEQALEAARLQRDIPLPPGASWEGFDPGDVSKDPYQFGAELALYAACVWEQDWLAALDAGDPDRAQAAVDAMAGVRSW